MAKSEYTIEPSRAPLDGVTVYEWGFYGRGSVLAGQRRKAFVDHFNSVEEALKKYPKAEVLGGRRSANNYFNHLPGEDDPVPGGMYPDDIGS